LGYLSGGLQNQTRPQTVDRQDVRDGAIRLALTPVPAPLVRKAVADRRTDSEDRVGFERPLLRWATPMLTMDKRQLQALGLELLLVLRPGNQYWKILVLPVPTVALQYHRTAAQYFREFGVLK
jgi:hypothetical protein